jgi:uncharacterized membrane protein YphA (DoxX/SURF4 family)
MKRGVWILLLLVLVPAAFAHTLYVISAEDAATVVSHPLNELYNPFNWILIACLPLAFWLLAHYTKNHLLVWKTKNISAKLASYEILVPWMMRLSLGILLIGAGTGSHLISPVVHDSAFNVLEIAFGFMLLLGLFTRIVAFATMFFYVYALLNNFYLLGTFEVFGASLFLFATGAGKPSIDDMLGLEHWEESRILMFLRREKSRILRTGIAVSFIFLGLYEKFLMPQLMAETIIKYNINSLLPFLSVDMWVLCTGIVEIALGILLLLDYRPAFVSVVTFAVLIVTFFFFKEDVSAHVTLFGTLSGILVLSQSRRFRQ